MPRQYHILIDNKQLSIGETHYRKYYGNVKHCKLMKFYTQGLLLSKELPDETPVHTDDTGNRHNPVYKTLGKLRKLCPK